MIHTLRSTLRLHAFEYPRRKSIEKTIIIAAFVILTGANSTDARSRIGNHDGKYTPLFRQFIERAFFYNEIELEVYLPMNTNMCRNREEKNLGVSIDDSNDVSIFIAHMEKIKMIQHHTDSHAAALDYFVNNITCSPFMISIDIEG